MLAACGRVGFDPQRDAQTFDAPSDAPSGITCVHPNVADDFTDPAVSPDWFVGSDPGIVIAETGGELVITLASSVSVSTYGEYSFMTNQDLRDRCATVTVAGTPTPGPTAEMTFNISDGGAGQYIAFSILNNQIGAYFTPSGSPIKLAQIAFDPVAHKILRLRESAGTLFWEMSPDAVHFTTLFSEPTPFDFSSGNVTMAAGTFGSVAAPGAARFDNFDIP